MGGSCIYIPLNEYIASLSLSSLISAVPVLRTFPPMSCVSVSTPKSIVVLYSFIPVLSISDTLVAAPRHTGNTPVASGSSVPA